MEKQQQNWLPMMSTMISGQLEEAKSQVQLQELSKVITNILDLTAELKNGTIEKVIGKSNKVIIY
ncbi:hypothetical protein LGL08_21805 [Clostridium estertheticum]|uniref:hypothetical protein n=1 Tax=Clostridium estertheticum TaxID=238834 RepID=UPI001CF30481|nr:hypothetical protein [Clostridium estertheticum]MCB2309206.1 hypothetical protein [Clostridium estertheticum]MCB2347569.1 hypothetical protein [Clostridium estertheticum]MCB2352162.1 hypothetical protein [Clostridium estertheticum]WAG48346.1 hypothetical protein LL127_22330 [Clostridium estertheticum]